MSLRIHELAKRLNMEGKELLTLLKERGYVSADTKSVSSTISNIYAEEIEKELGPKKPDEQPAAEVKPAPVVEEAVSGDDLPEGRVKLPVGVFVKSAADIAREKDAKAAAVAAARAPALPPRPVPARPAPAVSQPKPPPVLRPVHQPAAPSQPSAPRAAPSDAPAAVPRPLVSPSAVSPVLSAPPAPPPISRPPATPPLRPPPAVPKLPPLPVAPGAADAQAPAAPQGEVKAIIPMKPPIIVRDLATALGLKPFKLISELNQLVGFASMNSTVEEPVAQKVAEKYGFMLEIRHRGDAATQQQAKKEKEKKAEEDEARLLAPRPPVICILGHVDHGKTSLLDAIRKAHVAAGEAGGITQHIGAYQIEFNGRKLTFLDTPGHAAFNKMRARGAAVTDIAVLVVAADDGFMPQTDEALQHAKNAKVTVIVAVNKMDVKGANLDQVKAQMQQRGIAPDDWGGDTVTVPVSAVKGTGLKELLEMICLQADILELKANPKAEPAGVIIESQMDVGRGPLATVIVQRGTLKVGDALVCGPYWAKVRAMFDDQGNPLKEAPPSSPARIIGWSGTPDSGAPFRAVKNAREAENLAEEEAQRLKKVDAATSPQKEVSVEQLFASIAANQQKSLKLIIKADVFGSAEAVRQVLEGIKSSKVQLEIVSADVGLVTKNDVLMASAAGAVVIGFNTKLENGVTPLAKHHGVRIETYDIIYELGDKVREMMADLLEPEQKEVKLGAAEVRATFPLARGLVAGCLVTEGRISRNFLARLRRGKETVFEGRIATLKRFKDDANEVRAGLECGVKLDDCNDYQVGDVIECFEVQKVRASL